MLEEVLVLINTHFINTLSETKSSTFLKKVIMNQSVVDVMLFKRILKTLICTVKTMKVIGEMQRINSGLGQGKN